MTCKEIMFEVLAKMYMRTFPPIGKNGTLSEIKRGLLMIPINIITKGDVESELEKMLKRWESYRA